MVRSLFSRRWSNNTLNCWSNVFVKRIILRSTVLPLSSRVIIIILFHIDVVRRSEFDCPRREMDELGQICLYSRECRRRDLSVVVFGSKRHVERSSARLAAGVREATRTKSSSCLSHSLSARSLPRPETSLSSHRRRQCPSLLSSAHLFFVRLVVRTSLAFLLRALSDVVQLRAVVDLLGSIVSRLSHSERMSSNATEERSSLFAIGEDHSSGYLSRNSSSSSRPGHSARVRCFSCRRCSKRFPRVAKRRDRCSNRMAILLSPRSINSNNDLPSLISFVSSSLSRVWALISVALDRRSDHFLRTGSRASLASAGACDSSSRFGQIVQSASNLDSSRTTDSLPRRHRAFPTVRLSLSLSRLGRSLFFTSLLF